TPICSSRSKRPRSHDRCGQARLATTARPDRSPAAADASARRGDDLRIAVEQPAVDRVPVAARALLLRARAEAPPQRRIPREPLDLARELVRAAGGHDEDGLSVED